MNDDQQRHTTRRIHSICKALVWITFWIMAIGGCVRCHEADRSAQNHQEKR